MQIQKKKERKATYLTGKEKGKKITPGGGGQGRGGEEGGVEAEEEERRVKWR